jgi:RNA polymerase subunit RPABC4/transcription elongation factor Spt4
MFKKKKCSNCKSKIEEKFDFCPYCGTSLSSGDMEDGLLGKNDFTPIANEMKIPMGLNAILNSMMKNMNKEFEQLNTNFPKESKSKGVKKDGISISISTFGNGPPKIKINNMGNNQKVETKKIVEKKKEDTFTKERIKKFTNLIKEEPKTNIRRLANKVIYEIEMPEVKEIDDVSILKLENSIEIKAVGEKKAYKKIIPINLPIINYDLSEGRLILELGIKN